MDLEKVITWLESIHKSSSYSVDIRCKALEADVAVSRLHVLLIRDEIKQLEVKITRHTSDVSKIDIDVQTQDKNGNWVKAAPLPLMCEVNGCSNPVTDRR